MFDPQAIIAEATANAPKAEVNAPEQETQATSEEAQVIETNEATQDNNQETDDISKKPDSELTPEQLAKREANRQSHLNRKLAKQRLREENAQLKARLSELEKSTSKPSNQQADSDYPSENDYDSIIDYMKAVAKYEAKQEFKSVQDKNTQHAPDPQKIHRINVVTEQAAKLVSDVPEYGVLYRENQDTLNTMPESVMDAFLEADNAPLALYALMKEGRLEDLEDLSPSRIAMEIGRAEERGKSYLSAVKKATSTPAPIESVKGTGRASKSLDELSIPELMKRFNR